jgi:glycosyltransferase involved in cell wall biosynthesis
VIIPCRNEARHIEACLRDVLAFESPPEGFEVLVVDGMSEDGTREILAAIGARDPRVRVLDNPFRTTPHALNIGIRAARSEIVVRVDAHTLYAQDYLRQCVAILEETGADNVGGPARTRAVGYVQRAIAAAYHSRFAVGNSVFHQPSYEGPADTVPYGCYRVRRLQELGMFDEELIRNQDDELNLRLLRSGGRIWQSPRIRSWYAPRASLGQLFRQYLQYGYWKVRVIQKHRLPASFRHLVPGGFAATLTLLTLAMPFSSTATVLLAIVLLLYAAAVAVASAITAAREGLDLAPILPVVFACYHLGYGFGFLLGVWDFVLRRRNRGRLVELTRG